LRDNGLNVIIGVRKNGASWREAEKDGWVPGKNLFEMEEAIKKGTIVMNLLSDAAQSETWPAIKPLLTKEKVRFSQFRDGGKERQVLQVQALKISRPGYSLLPLPHTPFSAL
jgi:hypothetical protein